MPIIHVQNHSISLFVQNHSISLFAATIFPWSSALNLSAYLPDTTYHNLWSFFLLGILLLLLLLNHPIRLLSLPWEHSSGPIHLLFSYKSNSTSDAPTILGPSADSTSTYNITTRPGFKMVPPRSYWDGIFTMVFFTPLPLIYLSLVKKVLSRIVLWWVFGHERIIFCTSSQWHMWSCS